MRAFDGERVQNYRREKGLSRTLLAGLCDTTSPTVANWETGRTEPLANTLVKIALNLGVDVNDLYSERN